MASNNQIPFVEIELTTPSSFYVKSIQRDLDIEDDKELSHRHNFQEIIWIKSGSGTQLIDERVLTISEKTFYIIAQGQVHKLIEGRNLNGIIIQYQNDYVSDFSVNQSWKTGPSLFKLYANEGAIRVGDADALEFEILLKQVTDEYNRTDAFGKDHILRHLLNIILIKLERVIKERFAENLQTSEEQVQLYSFLSRLDESFHQDHQVTGYANKVGISSRRLSGITKRILGKTAKEIILERIMLEAKRYLNFSSLSVKEIAYKLGFDDPSYFSKLFKQECAVSPQHYRKQSRFS